MSHFQEMNQILQCHSPTTCGGIGEQKRNCFCSRSRNVWNQNFLCPIISLLTKLPLKHFLPLLGHLSGSARHKDKGSETLGKPLLCSLSKMVRLCESPRIPKRWVECSTRGPEQCPLFLGSLKDKSREPQDTKKIQQYINISCKIVGNVVMQRPLWRIQCKWVRNRWIEFPFNSHVLASCSWENA